MTKNTDMNFKNIFFLENTSFKLIYSFVSVSHIIYLQTRTFELWILNLYENKTFVQKSICPYSAIAPTSCKDVSMKYPFDSSKCPILIKA